MDPQLSPFESNIIRLLSLERGHPSFTSSQEPVELHFTLTEEEAVQVARWNNRGKINRYVVHFATVVVTQNNANHPTHSNLSTSMCVSLVSYPLEQCAQAFECEPDGEQSELDVVGFGRPRPWPEDGSVYVVLDVSGDHGPPRSINVAPPFGFVSLLYLPTPSARRHCNPIRTPSTNPWISGIAEYTQARTPSTCSSSATTRTGSSPLFCTTPRRHSYRHYKLLVIANGRWRIG